jgi:hypothetical protein
MSVISRILSTRVPYQGFPQPIAYRSKYGYTRYKCPIRDCPYDGITGGFNQHYARKHAPEWWGWHNKQIEKALTQPHRA